MYAYVLHAILDVSDLLHVTFTRCNVDFRGSQPLTGDDDFASGVVEVGLRLGVLLPATDDGRLFVLESAFRLSRRSLLGFFALCCVSKRGCVIFI